MSGEGEGPQERGAVRGEPGPRWHKPMPAVHVARPLVSDGAAARESYCWRRHATAQLSKPAQQPQPCASSVLLAIGLLSAGRIRTHPLTPCTAHVHCSVHASHRATCHAYHHLPPTCGCRLIRMLPSIPTHTHAGTSRLPRPPACAASCPASLASTAAPPECASTSQPWATSELLPHARGCRKVGTFGFRNIVQ